MNAKFVYHNGYALPIPSTSASGGQFQYSAQFPVRPLAPLAAGFGSSPPSGVGRRSPLSQFPVGYGGCEREPRRERGCGADTVGPAVLEVLRCGAEVGDGAVLCGRSGDVVVGTPGRRRAWR